MASSPPHSRPARPSVGEVLDVAVAALGGQRRDGQAAMAEAVAESLRTGEHLLVQAGTGTGKSLAYLVPALVHALSTKRRVVVATATLTLQAQIIDRDLPRLVDAVSGHLGRRPLFAISKGRSNYVCKAKLAGAVPDEDSPALFAAPTTPLGREVNRARGWADETDTGDRDELLPGVSNRAWRQVSVTARECVGAQKCAYGAECFAELARAKAAEADVVVTNHALLALDALESFAILPEHDAVIIDEAHELVDRVTGVATEELTASMVERAASRAARLVGQAEVSDLEDAAAALGGVLELSLSQRLSDPLPQQLAAALEGVRDGARQVQSAMTANKGGDDAERRVARVAVDAVFDTSERLLATASHDVAWLTASDLMGRTLHVAPLSVAGLLRATLFTDHTVVCTSATLELGGSFDLLARGLGLTGASVDEPTTRARYRGLDVGSPFDPGRQGMLYVARHLPPPGRDALSPETVEELLALIRAAGGRTLGLFSSTRAVGEAAAAVHEGLADADIPLLVQGEGTTSELVRRFAADARTCLFGTMSLWQGVDVPGPALQLVIIDRIPFPRPDDPLMAARKDAAGPSGFRSVYAAHAALRLAQGAGRLLRSIDDRGVVAVLDSRLSTAGYASFLRSSMPPFWSTTDRDIVLRSLARIDADALPVHTVLPVPSRTSVALATA